MRWTSMAKLLIVDDDHIVGDLLAALMVSEGHEVHIARDGRDGLLALVHGELPELVLLDVEMPILTGPEMAYAMFFHDAGMEKIPVILLSGVLDLPAVAAAVGTPYFLEKPYTLDRLLALIHKALVERTPPCPPPACDSETSASTRP
jgi:DNA-binding NtrC family response regulator